MSMNMIIMQRRKNMGLTQEQVAESLNVSIPAVSKWESGATSPDISLLPALARLLEIDMNELFCFRKDLTKEEISDFCKKLTQIAQTEGIENSFEAAKKNTGISRKRISALLYCYMP